MSKNDNSASVTSIAGQTVPEPVQTYLDLRKLIFNLVPEEIGITPTQAIPNVWGVVMETGYPAGVATLVSLADGTTSLYFGTGGGMIGSGNHPAIAKASKSFVSHAEEFIQTITPTCIYPLALIGRVQFYILSYSGVLAEEASEADLRSGQHKLSILYSSGQQVITQLRLAQEHQK